MDKQKERNAKMKRKKKNGKEGLHNLARDRSLVERLRVRNTRTRDSILQADSRITSNRVKYTKWLATYASRHFRLFVRSEIWLSTEKILCRIISVKFRSILYSYFSIRWRAVQLSHRLSKSCVIRFLFSLNAREFIS